MRCDCTVQEADIRHPTDSGLAVTQSRCWLAARKVYATLATMAGWAAKSSSPAILKMAVGAERASALPLIASDARAASPISSGSTVVDVPD